MFFDPSRQTEAKASEWVRHFHQRSRVSSVEARLRLALQRRLAILRPEVSPLYMVNDLAAGKLPRPGYTTITESRFRYADFPATESDALARRWAERFESMGRTPNSAEVRSTCEQAANLVARIRKRGGEVLFVRMPSAGMVASIEERRFPRENTWDVLASTVGIRAIHFADAPGLSGFECPDDSHLAGRDSARFSAGVAVILRGSLTAEGSAPSAADPPTWAAFSPSGSVYGR